MDHAEISSEEFEGALFSVAQDSSFLLAGEDPPLEPLIPSSLPPTENAEATRTLLDAIERLQQNPSLLSGDPEGFYTYEDPILAVALRACQINAEEIASAGQPGEELRNTNIIRFGIVGVQALLSRLDRSIQELAGQTPTRVIQAKHEKVRFAILGDAGYRGQAQDNVIHLILREHQIDPFHFAIHLGDTYYGGDEAEVLKNLLGPLSSLRNAGIQVFTLVGNHDVYYGADGFLAALKILNQPGRYFLIETPAWRIACLDTALSALGIFRSDAKLDQGQLDWLDSLINAKDNRPLIVMSHHFIVSGWENPPPSLVHQMRERAKEGIFAWYWGHEHGCATYERGSHGFYGACVGNGAFNERWSQPTIAPSKPSWYATTKCACYTKARKRHFWPHGFLELTLSNQQFLETYHLEGGVVHSRTLQGMQTTGAHQILSTPMANK